MYIVLMYDIHMDKKGAKIRKKIFDLCKKYLHHIQLSVFEGQINKSELFRLEKSLNRLVRDDLDSIIIFKSIFNESFDKTFIGIKVDKTSNFL